jgi:hypothetical protein
VNVQSGHEVAEEDQDNSQSKDEDMQDMETLGDMLHHVYEQVVYDDNAKEAKKCATLVATRQKLCISATSQRTHVSQSVLNF